MTRATTTALALAQVAFASVPRPGKTRNEDLVAAVDGVAMLLDGASVPAGMPACCDRDAAWYVRRLAAALITALSGDGTPDLKDVLADAISTTDRVHAAGCTGQDRNAMGPNATVALVRRHGDRLDWLVLGDSTLLLDTGQSVAEYCDRGVKTIEPELRQRIFNQLRNGNGYDDPAHRQTLATIVESERRLRNTPGGYWIAGADPAAAAHSLTGSYRIGAEPGEVRRFALLSDGAERAVTMFGLYPSWQALLDALAADGPAACIAAVRAAEAADPDGRRYPRSKLSDDASALLCNLVEAAHGS
jgi:hypothetical protein